MNHTTRAAISEAAHLERACELLIQHIKRVEDSVFGTEQLTPHQEGLMADANMNAASAIDHIELATQYVDRWYEAVNYAANPYQPR